MLFERLKKLPVWVYLLIPLAMGLWVRLSTHRFFFQDIFGHLNFFDPDSYYHLRRLVHFIEHFPSLMSFDPLVDWPEGSFVDWPEGLLVLVGTPLRLLGVKSFYGLELGASLIMLMLGLVLCLLAYALACQLFKQRHYAIFLALWVAVHPLLVMYSSLGSLDHHIIEAIMPPLVLLLAWKAFCEKSWRSQVLLGLTLFYSLSVSSSHLFVLGAFYLAYACALGSRENSKGYAITHLCLVLPLVLYASWKWSETGKAFFILHASFFHVFLLLALSLSAWFCARYRQYALWVILGFFGVAFLTLQMGWPEALSSNLRGAFRYVFLGGGSGPLQFVTEAQPLLSDFDGFRWEALHHYLGYGVYLTPLAFLIPWKWKSLNQKEKSLILFALPLLVFGLAQQRFGHFFIVLYFLILCWGFSYLIQYLQEREFRLSPLLILAFLALMYSPILQYGSAPRMGAMHRVDFSLLKHFHEEYELEAKKHWNRLALKEPVEHGIWANPNLGHILLYTTGMGVVSNVYYHREGLYRGWQFRQQESPQELDELLLENKIAYFFLSDDLRYYTMLHRIRGEDPSYFRSEKGDAITFDLEPLDDYAWAQMLFFDASSPPSYEKFLQIRLDEPGYFYQFIRGYRLTEDLPE